MSSTSIRLSKSKLAAFAHCPRRLWLQVHRRHEAKFDKATLARFQFGHDVGRKARFALPDGWLVETGWDMPAAIAETKRLIDDGFNAPIFEGTFQHENVLVRVDILQPYGDEWELVEVKATSRPSSHHLSDVSTQLWVLRGCGINVTKVTIRHLASRIDWRRPDIGGIKFKDTDVTAQLDRFLCERPSLALAASQIVSGPEPQRAMGPYCQRPFSCEFRAHCGN